MDPIKRKLIFWSVLFVLFSLFDLHDGLSLGGDSSQYLAHARNIVERRPYAQGFDIETKLIPPPGFPLLLAPLVKISGLNLKVLKIPNIFYWLGFVLLFYSISKGRLGQNLAFWVCIFLLSTPAFFFMKQDILTDMPFLFFLTAALFFFDRYSVTAPEDGKGGGSGVRTFCLIMGVLALFVSFVIRWAAIIFYAAVFFYFIFIKKDKRVVIVSLVSLALAILLQYGFGSSLEFYWGEISQPFSVWLKLSYQRVSDIISRLWMFLFPSAFSEEYAAVLREATGQDLLTKVFSVILPLALVGGFIQRVRNRSVYFVDCFFVFYLLGIVFWWKHGNGRYLLPVLGLVWVFMLEGAVSLWRNAPFAIKKYLRFSPQRILKLLLIFCIVNNMVNIFVRRNDDRAAFLFPADTNFSEMISWVKSHTSPGDRLCCVNPRQVALYADRPTIGLSNRYSKLSPGERIKTLGVDYFIISRSTDYLSLLGGEKIGVRVIWENPAYKILSIEN